MDAKLLKAFLPNRWQILQLELKPFCLGHNVTLNALESPFVSEEPRDGFTALDLFTAVAVCSFSWEDGVEFVSHPDNLTAQFKRWFKKIDPTTLDEKALRFIDYMDEGNQRPDYQIHGEITGPTIYTPWQQRMLIRLMKDLGMSESQVMNRPLARCWWDYYTLLEFDNSLTICTEKEKAIVDELEKAEQWLGRQN